jgi:hypothetical protein
MRTMDFKTCAATASICCRPWPRPGLGDAEVMVADVLDERQGIGGELRLAKLGTEEGETAGGPRLDAG